MLIDNSCISSKRFLLNLPQASLDLQFSFAVFFVLVFTIWEKANLCFFCKDECIVSIYSIIFTLVLSSTRLRMVPVSESVLTVTSMLLMREGSRARVGTSRIISRVPTGKIGCKIHVLFELHLASAPIALFNRYLQTYFLLKTRMHSSRMCTDRRLTVSWQGEGESDPLRRPLCLPRQTPSVQRQTPPPPLLPRQSSLWTEWHTPVNLQVGHG